MSSHRSTLSVEGSVNARRKSSDAAAGVVLMEPRPTPRGRVTGTLLVCTLAAVAGAFQYGLLAGAPNIPEAKIKEDLDIKHSIEWSMVNAAFTIGGLVGAQAAGVFINHFGRKSFLVWHSWLFVISGALQFWGGSMFHHSQRHTAYTLVVIGRFFGGVGGGAATVGVPMFLGEVAPKYLRGMFGAFTQLVLVSGILVAELMGLALNRTKLWRWLLGSTGILGIIQVFTGPMFVESPKFLVSQGRNDEAIAVLVRLRGYSTDDAALEVLEIESTSNREPSPSLWSVLTNKSLRMPLVISLVMMYVQQLSGINAVFFYSSSFFKSAGIKNASLGTCLVGGINVLATFVAVQLMERAGRRKLMLWGVQGMIFSCVGLTSCLLIKKYHSDLDHAMGILSIVFVMLFVSFFELGPGPIPWLIGSEIFPEAPRGTAMSFCAANNWLANTMIALFFQDVNKALDEYSFVPFACVLLAGYVFIKLYVPETKGRSLAEIQEDLKRGRAESDIDAPLLRPSDPFGDFQDA